MNLSHRNITWRGVGSVTGAAMVYNIKTDGYDLQLQFMDEWAKPSQVSIALTDDVVRKILRETPCLRKQ